LDLANTSENELKAAKPVFAAFFRKMPTKIILSREGDDSVAVHKAGSSESQPKIDAVNRVNEPPEKSLNE